MVRKKKRSLLTKAQIDVLYECWKEGNNTKERLALIEEKLPKVSTVLALKVMRKMAKTDTKWLKWSTRQQNIKEKEKEKRKDEIERKKIEKEKRRKEREKRRIEREEKQRRKHQRERISNNIEDSLVSDMETEIPSKFFFCSETHQYVNTILCIYRIFNKDYSFGNVCDNCRKMDKYIPLLKEIVDGRSTTKKQGTKRHKTCDGSKNKTEKAES